MRAHADGEVLAGVSMVRVLAALTASVFLVGTASAQTASHDRIAARDADVDGVVAGVPGFSGIVASSRGGAVTHLAAYGLADRDAGRAHSVDQAWRWSSVTKMITAILVLQQVDDGRLALDATIDRYLPDFPVNADRITLRQLLTHTSGLANPSNTPDLGPDGVPDGNPDFYQTEGDWRPTCHAAPDGEPGGAFSYNNCDFYVLGAVLEAVTGQSYGDLIRWRIAQPLGLGDIGVPSDGLRVEAYKADGSREAPELPAAWGAAAGVYGTASDLLAIDTALMDGRLISEASRAEMWKGDPAAGFAALSVWSYSPNLGACLGQTRLVERYGEVGGVQVRNFLLPDHNVAVVVYSNDGTTQFGEIWRGEGLSIDLLRAAACGADTVAGG